MRTIAQILSWLAIVGTILPSFLYLFNSMSLENCQLTMLAATIVWFVATPLWMGREPQTT